MKQLAVTFGLLLMSGYAMADSFCTQEQVERGCRMESYDCDRPTHYTSTACMCPTPLNAFAEPSENYFALNGGGTESSSTIDFRARDLCEGPNPPPPPRCR